jgi:DNA polymerase-1
MLVGEAPSYREEDLSGSLQGKSGKLLSSILSAFSIKRESIFISNAIHCRLEEGSKPKPSEIDACRRYLKKEVKLVQPKLIIALGAVAGQGLLQQKVTIGSARNRLHYTTDPFPKIPVVVTYHPAAALRNDYLVETIVKDFEWAMEIMKYGPPKAEKTKYIYVDSVRKIPYIGGLFSIDFETDSLDPYLPGMDMICLQVCTLEGEAYLVPWNPETKTWLKSVVNRPNAQWVNHNMKFELKWYHQLMGHWPKCKIFCTLIGGHLLDENMREKDLESMASMFTPIKDHKQELHKYMKENKLTRFRDVPLPVLTRYGCADVDSALRLGKVFAPRIRRAGLGPLMAMQMDAVRLFAEVEHSGFKVDVSLIDEMGELYQKRVDRRQAKLNELIGEEINIDSWQQVGHWLYDEWDLPALGKPKDWKSPPVKNTAEDTLLKLLERGLDGKQRRFIKHILYLRETKKLLSTYILGLWDFIRPGDLVHPNFKLHGTVTGRLSCTDPNFQNIPRDGDIKRLFISRYGPEGNLMQVDVSQGELRLAAHYAKEKALLEAFRSGTKDIHRSVAARVLRIPESEVTEKQRKKAKVVNFGILYGAGEYKMAEEMKCSVDEARQFIKEWQAEFPDWMPYVRKMKARVLRDHQVTSIFGRVRRLPIMDPDTYQAKEAIRQAVNSPIQGGLSDFTVECGWNARTSLKGKKVKRWHLVAGVHDAWIIDVHNDSRLEVAKTFRDAFRNPDLRRFGIRLDVPMDVEIKIGPNWKEMEVYEEDLSC